MLLLLLLCRPAARRSALHDKLRARLPLHLSMTEATCARFELLKQRYSQTVQLQKLTLQQHPHQHSCTQFAASAMGATAAPGAGTAADLDLLGRSMPQQLQFVAQLLTVTIQGAVLSKAHVRAGSFMSAEQQQDAAKLLAGRGCARSLN